MFGPNGQPFMFPMMIQHQPQQPNQPERAPIRVRTALEYLAMLDTKTMPRAAVSDATCIELDPVQLELEERETRVIALKLLNSYFEGKFQQTKQEKDIEAQKNKPDERIKGPGMILRCVGCVDRRQLKPGEICQICKGTGEIIVFPTTSPVHGVEET